MSTTPAPATPPLIPPTDPTVTLPPGGDGRSERRSGRHPVSVGHLVMGIAFLGIVGVWALVQADVVQGSHIRWLLPVPWVLAGLAGLVATAIGGSRRWSTRQVGWVTPAAPAAPTSETDADDTAVLPTEDPDLPEEPR